MQIAQVQWTDDEHSGLSAVVDGEKVWIPADSKNRHYAEIIRQKIAILDPG